ncbi:uncharacterized protein LOC113648450 isoform X3 [Tachysurus ichikawai]
MFPTLVVAGAAAAGAFYYMKRRGDGESTTESTDTSPTQVQTAAPVDSSLMDSSSLFLEAGVCSDDSEEREQEKLCLAQAMESRARMENENIDLLSRMSTLRCSMHHLKQEFTEARRKISERREQEQDKTFKTSDLSPNLTHNEQTLLENEQLMQIHNILKMRYKRMLESITQCNAFLMVIVRGMFNTWTFSYMGTYATVGLESVENPKREIRLHLKVLHRCHHTTWW